MKKIIPFKKELPFKTKISDITSISLEHTLNLKEDDLISGTFYISGEYKMTETSINKEPFNYEIPFDIALDSRFDINEIKIDIDDFYYEILNNDILKVCIDVFIEGAELTKKEEVRCEKDESGRCIEAEDLETNIIYEEIPQESLEEIERDNDMNDINIDITNENNNLNENNINLFNNLSENETFSTYSVYIVKEDDTIEKILETFKITKEELYDYNDIKELTKGDKLIIPAANE